ncbi:MAG TPA: phosphoribosylglycinamide formyltransferase [bacterium]|nr:phosphoribosylglycinamide formyltransferase [bacterium]
MKDPAQTSQPSKARVAVLVSGNGSNLQAILDAATSPSYPAQVVLVLSNKKDAFALERARKAGVPAEVVEHGAFADRPSFENALIASIEKAGADLVVLAGFMRVLSPHFIKKFPNRILNIHPALLPSFPGTRAIEQAWNYGAKVTGVTVHFVDEGTDTGPIVLQEAVPIIPKETLESLEKKVHFVEHRLFPEAIRLFAEKKLAVAGRKVTVS